MVDTRPWSTRALARQAVVEYIGWYNGTRLGVVSTSWRSQIEHARSSGLGPEAIASRVVTDLALAHPEEDH